MMYVRFLRITHLRIGGRGGALSPGTIIIITELSEEEAAPLDVIRRIHSLS